MIYSNPERDTAIFYTCGICNLQCRYCGIDKNPILKEIDNKLDESFNGDYYFERLKKYFKKGQLKKIETWGGEPFLHMDRIYNLLHQIINYYPYFDSMYSSTNFSYPQWEEKVFSLFEQFRPYQYRRFNYCLQLSVDGPQYINDKNRGDGVTKKCIQNFDAFCDHLLKNPIPDNLNLSITLKGTLDNPSIKILCEKDKIIDYYKFYEDNFIKKIKRLNLPNVDIYLGIPNTAVPSPVTVEDGIIFSKLVKLCREIEQENIEKHYFEYYTEITPFANNSCQNCLTYKYNYHTCGSGNSMVGFLPDNMISICHEGFTELIEQYKKLAETSDRINSSTITFDRFIGEDGVKLCLTDDEYIEYEKKISYYNVEGASARLANISSLIRTLAMCGQIEKKYSTEVGALKAAIFIQSHTSYCIKDNIRKTGSITQIPVGLIKLLLNGAMDYILQNEEMKVN